MERSKIKKYFLMLITINIELEIMRKEAEKESLKDCSFTPNY